MSPRRAPRFDERYYQRFYEACQTGTGSESEVRKRVDFVRAYMRLLDLPLRSVLDVGCGLGRWRGALARRVPKLEYTGIEKSRYLSRELGWRQASIETYRGRGEYDLVICQSVLAYLTAQATKRAIRNLGRLCRGALYLEVLTREDAELDRCDPEGTDMAVHLRRGSWYRKLLGRDFIACGGGLYVARRSGAVLLELERHEP